MIAHVPIGVLPTPNDRMHFMKRARMVKLARDVTAVLVRSAMAEAKVSRATDHRHIHLTLVRGKGQKLLDLDNAVAALKPVADGCKDAGLIVDDKAAYVTVTYSQERGDHPAAVVVYEPQGAPS